MGAEILPSGEIALANDEFHPVHNISMISVDGDGDSSENPARNCDWAIEDDDDKDTSSSNESHSTADRTAYWESQHSLLQEIIEHHNSIGAKLRQEILGIIETARETNFCRCLKPKLDGGNCCRCLRQRVVNLLCSKGFNATLCTSQWRHTSICPGGTHEYIEVIASTQSRKKQIPFLVELQFRDEFKMAKACEEYHNLINQLLPEVYIGKAEHLNAIVRVVCDAAKRSTAEKRIHLGPWRKRSFMQKKWSVSSRLLSRSSFSSSNELAVVSSMRQVDMPRVSSYSQFSVTTAVEVT